MDGREMLAKFIEANTTQAQLARDVDCSDSHLSLILKGKRQPSLDLAVKLSERTGISTKEFLKNRESIN